MIRGEGLMKRSTAFKTTAALLAVFALLPLFAACNKTAKAEYFDIFGTTAYIETYDADDAEKTESGMRRVEELCSVNIEGSDIWRINAAHAGETVTVDEVTMLLLTRAMSVYELTDGCYDPTVYPLVELWGFAAGDFVAGTPPEGGIPTDEEISAALALVGFDRAFSLNASECTVTKLIEGAKLDLGGIAKGYASSLAFSVSFDICNVGGNLAVGMPAATIGVPAPRETETVSSSWLFSFKAAYGQCVSTSGDYERYYFVDGVRYHHIIDPRTGYPASSGLASATVISTDGSFADAFATAVIVGGKDAAERWMSDEDNTWEFDLVTVTENNEVTSQFFSVLLHSRSLPICILLAAFRPCKIIRKSLALRCEQFRADRFWLSNSGVPE